MTAPIKRYSNNPILQASQIPYDADLIFNAGVTKFNGQYVMVFRNDYHMRTPQPKTNIGVAFSDDGLKWNVSPKPCFHLESDEIKRAYDPRLSVIDGKCYMCFAVDTLHGIRGGIAVTEDFNKWEVLSLSLPDNRNMVLFPERVNGKFLRLERPFPIYGHTKGNENFDLWFSDSPDCKYWGNHRLVLGAENVPYANCKIGPAAPPIKTKKGWLTTFHAVYKDANLHLNTWEKHWYKKYYAGIMLLDLNEPWKVIGISPEPLLEPEEAYPYEMNGFRGSVIFPGGMILEDDGEVKIYYGAADTVEALATANVEDLLNLCKPL